MFQDHAVTLTFKVATQLACDTSYQYGYHFCEKVLKSDLKKRNYEPDIILLQGHAVTLTLKLTTQLLHATRRLNIVIISVKNK